MKLFSEYKNAYISMQNDAQLANTLHELSFAPIEYIIETGTYHGLGSSTIISENFKDSKHLKQFYTCEVNLDSYNIARENLKKYPFVKCVYGNTLNTAESIKFVENDDAIKNHSKYPDIFIDDIKNPIEFYTRELKGFLNAENRNWFRKLVSMKMKQELLSSLISEHISSNLFIVLDSAGGTGYLEYQITMNLLKGKKFWLLLDDTHHLKHFRTVIEIKESKFFKVLSENIEQGWLIALHEGE